MAKAREYWIVNPKGAIHKADRGHAEARLKLPGWRMATPAEIKEWKGRIEKAEKAGTYLGKNGEKIKKERAIQRFDSPLAKPWNPDPDAVLDEIDEGAGVEVDEPEVEAEVEDGEK